MVAPTNNYLDVLEKKKEELEKEENTITYPKSIKLGEHTLKIGDAADKDHSLVVKKIEKTGDKISLKLGYSNETDEEETVKIDLLKISTENEETKTDWMQESGNPITLIFTKKEKSQSMPEKKQNTIEKTESLEEKIKRLENEVKTETEDLEKIDNKIIQIKDKIEIEKNKIEKENARIKEIKQQLKTLFEKPEEKETKKEVVKEMPTTPETEIEKKLEETLTPEENKMIEGEMKNSTPEPFEPEEVKNNKGLFLKNLVVKSTTILKDKIPEGLKKIAGKLRSKALLGVAVFSLFASTSGESGATSYVVPSKNIDNSKNKIELFSTADMESKTEKKYLDAFHIKNPEDIKKAMELADIKTIDQLKKVEKMDTALYNKMSPKERIIYLYCLTNMSNDDNFIMINKENCWLRLISAKDGKVIIEFPVILGACKEDISKGVADMDVPRTKEYAVTPPGKFTLIGDENCSEEDKILYQGYFFELKGTDGVGIHIVYPREYQQRQQALETPGPDYMSWGCINGPDDLIKGPFAQNITKGKTTVFITTYDKKTAINPSTGKIGSVEDVNKLFSEKI